jgi:hypothetical protein
MATISSTAHSSGIGSEVPSSANGQGTPRASSRQLARRLVWLSLGLYLIACFLPGLSFQAEAPHTGQVTYSGGWLLVIGWLGLLAMQFAWLANPIVLLAWLLLSRYAAGAGRSWALAALIAGIAALVLSADTLTLFSYNVPARGDDMVPYRLEQVLAGTYFWWASQTTVALGALLSLRNARPQSS